jgi:hypothetical protein
MGALKRIPFFVEANAAIRLQAQLKWVNVCRYSAYRWQRA